MNRRIRHPDRKPRRPRATARPNTPKAASRSFATPPTSASGPACTSATPAPRGCTTSSTSWSTTASTRPWPAIARTSTSTIHVDGSRQRQPTTAAASPSTIHPEAGRPTLEVVLTTVGAGAKFDKRHLQDLRRPARHRRQGGHRPVASGPRPRSAATAQVYMQEYERGNADHRGQGDRRRRQRAPAPRSPSSPTREIFHDATFDYDTLEARLRELAFLNKGLAIKLHRRAHRQGRDVPLRRRRRRVRRVPEPHRGAAAHADLRRQDRRRRPRRGRPPVHHRRGRARPLLRQQRLQPRRRHAPVRLPRRPDARAQRLRQQGEPVQERPARRSARTSARA